MNNDNYKKQLHLRIDEVLHYVWDPIGISDTPPAKDEYSTYAASVWRDVLEGKSKAEIAAYLTNVATDRMGLEPSKDHDEEVAELIMKWAEYLKDR